MLPLTLTGCCYALLEQTKGAEVYQDESADNGKLRDSDEIDLANENAEVVPYAGGRK